MWVKEKGTATFICEFSEENVKPVWMKGGQKLTTDNKYEIVTDKKVQKLIIRDVTVKDKGEYTCIYRDTSTWAKLVVGGEFLWKKIIQYFDYIKYFLTFKIQIISDY